MSHSPEDVAEWFIHRAHQDGEYLSQMKLQKLVYIAHGWSLALRSKPLVSGEFQAWKWGPVMPSLYKRFAMFGSGPIDVDALLPPKGFDREESALLEKIWLVYRRYTASQLSDMTHRRDTPWSEAYNPEVRGAVIRNDAIREHYSGLLKSTVSN